MALSSPTWITTNQEIWQAFRYHSRTFSLATRLLPRPARMPIATLYLFCRTVDTIADERSLEVGSERALEDVYALKDKLDAMLAGRPDEAFIWQRLYGVHQQVGLETTPLYELIEGAVWDLRGRPIETEQDLIDYSNLVGGSIGAMVLPFLLDERQAFSQAEPAARALGIAMQITNICRDVGDDLRYLDRIYIPRLWLSQHGIAPEMLQTGLVPEAYPALMEKMMVTAEALFREGMADIDLLPARVQTGIKAAARMYREILNEVRAQHYNNLTHRAFVPFRRKCFRVMHDSYERRKARLNAARSIGTDTMLAPVDLERSVPSSSNA